MRAEGNGGKNILEERHFRRMEKYDGGEAKCEKWWFDLTTVVGGVDQELERVLGEVTDPMKSVETKREFEEVVGEGILNKYSGELFTVLSSLTTGEASTVVRGTVTKENGKCGFRAIRKLMTRFNPRTPAKLFKKLGEIVSPGAAKNMRDVPKVVEEWEVNVVRLEGEFNEVLSER